MAFVIQEVEELSSRVKIKTPQGRGKFKTEDVFVRFRKLSVTDFQDFSKRFRGAITGVDEDGEEFDEDVIDSDVMKSALQDNILDIEGIKDSSGQDVPFDSDILDRMLDMTHVRGALTKAFLDIQSTGKVKNS